METVFIKGLVPKKSKFDFIVTNLHFNVKEFSEFLIEHRDYIESNNGWLTVDVMKSKKDPDKIYAKFTKMERRAEVSSSNHMPDREVVKQEESDVPF